MTPLPFNLVSSSISSQKSADPQIFLSELSVINPFATTTTESRYVSSTTEESSRRQQQNLADSQAVPNSRGQTALNTQGFSREVNTGSREEDNQTGSVAPSFQPDFFDDNDNEVVMAIDMRTQNTLGCAYYVAREEKLYCLQDCKLADRVMIDTCKSWGITSRRKLEPYQ